MRSSRTFRLSSLALLLVAPLWLAAPVAIAQNGSPVSPAQPAGTPEQGPSPQPSETRTRRASDEGPTGSQLKTSAEKSDNEVVAENKSAPKDKVLALRDEIEAAPNDRERSRLRLELVSRLAAAGMKQEALAELHSMSGEDHFDPQGLYNIANAQARLGDAEGAVISYRKAINQRKGHYSRALNNLGVVLLRLGKWDEAYEVLMSALRLESFRYAEASYNMGRLYDARGETDLATREWRRTIAIDPEHAAAANALARSGSTGNIRVARAPAVRRIDTAASRTTRVPEIERPASIKAPAKPSRSASPAPFTVDQETHTFLQRARTARDRGRNEEAVESYRRVIARMDGYFAPANLEVSYALISLRRTDEAIASLLPIAIKDAKRFPIAYYHLARLYELKGDLRLAEENFGRVADAYGESNAQFLLDLSRVREKLGDFPGALASLERYVTSMERQGQKPVWSDERLSALRQKVAATVPKP